MSRRFPGVLALGLLTACLAGAACCLAKPPDLPQNLIIIVHPIQLPPDLPMSEQPAPQPCQLAPDRFARQEVDPETTRSVLENLNALIRANDEHWERYAYGLWVFRDAVTGGFAGRGGLRHLEVGGGPEIEVAYALVAELWNRGLASEMAVAIVRLAFEELRIDNLVCFTQPTNYASRRVMEKAGFRYERDIVHAGLPHVFCRLERDSWKSGTGDEGCGPDAARRKE